MGNKKGQAWGFDLMIALVIFISGIVLFYLFSLNSPSQGTETLDELRYEAQLIGSNLVTPGFPTDWTSATVVQIGITDNGKINQTKLDRLYNITTAPSGYSATRSLFNTHNEYFFNFSTQMFIEGNPVEGIGNQPSSASNIIRYSRLAIYNDQPVTISILSWQP